MLLDNYNDGRNLLRQAESRWSRLYVKRFRYSMYILKNERAVKSRFEGAYLLQYTNKEVNVKGKIMGMTFQEAVFYRDIYRLINGAR